MKTLEILENGRLVAETRIDSAADRFYFLKTHVSPRIVKGGGLADKVVELGRVTWTCQDGTVIIETIA